MPGVTGIGDAKKAGVILIVVAVVVLVILFGKRISEALGTIFEGIGLNKSKEEKANDAVINTASETENRRGTKSPWSPLFFDTTAARTAKAKIFTVKSAQAIAKQIWDAIGIFTDTPSQILAAFRNCKTQSQVSFLSKAFSTMYNRDLFAWLTEKLDTETQRKTLREIIQYVDNLPKYQIKK
jgi:Sec-independent protein translocase protein TatA